MTTLEMPTREMIENTSSQDNSNDASGGSGEFLLNLFDECESLSDSGEFFTLQLPNGKSVVVISEAQITLNHAFKDPELIKLLRESVVDFKNGHGKSYLKGQRPAISKESSADDQ